jgi:hypothetical protein
MNPVAHPPAVSGQSHAPDAVLVEEPSVRVFAADPARLDEAAQVLLRAGFEVAGTAAAATPSHHVQPEQDSQQPSARDAQILVTHADLAVRVTRAAECLDDPTTTLMANLDTLQTDLLDGTLDVEDASELVGDCVSAIRQLFDGLQRLKAVAAPPVLPQEGRSDFDLVLRDAVLRHRSRSEVAVLLPKAAGVCVHGDRIALGQAFADVLEVLSARDRGVDAGPIQVVTARGGDGLHVFVSDAGPPLADEVKALLGGGIRPGSLDGLALLAASSLVRGVGGRLRVAEVPGRVSLEVVLPMVHVDECLAG